MAAGNNNKPLPADLDAKGFVHLPRQTAAQLGDFLRQLGTVIHTTDVAVKPESRALVTSARALDFHTDHYKAKWVVWHCQKQTDDGGESILVDAESIYARLSPENRAALAQIQLFEHKIFDGDEESRPLVSYHNGKRSFYYSFWLVNKNLPENQQAALDAFRAAIEREKPVTIKLQPGDILAVDNRRILHGRRIISGNKDRFLKRFWLSESIA